jgi:hypothetical protein
MMTMATKQLDQKSQQTGTEIRLKEAVRTISLTRGDDPSKDLSVYYNSDPLTFSVRVVQKVKTEDAAECMMTLVGRYLLTYSSPKESARYFEFAAKYSSADDRLRILISGACGMVTETKVFPTHAGSVCIFTTEKP